jgi:hypothetical protein
MIFGYVREVGFNNGVSSTVSSAIHDIVDSVIVIFGIGSASCIVKDDVIVDVVGTNSIHLMCYLRHGNVSHRRYM